MSDDLLKQKPLFDRYAAACACPLSAFSFVSVFTWADFFRFEFRAIEDNLCVFASDDIGTFLYLPPLGREFSPKAADAAFEFMHQANRGRGVSRIDNVPESWRRHFPEDRFRHQSKGHEYIYVREDIALLSGNAYKSQRALCNYFVKHYDFEFRFFAAGDTAACLDLYDRWSADRREKNTDAVYRQMLDDNRRVHERIMRFASALGLTGRVISVDGTVRAYTFGYALTPEIFCILCEVADLQFKGIAVTIFRALCDDGDIRRFRFVNAMDDFAMANVARTKMSFKPAILWPSYTVTRLKI
ncbi:MAG: hypothetical protein Q8Q08_06370 [Candidatus Omnitrophota bacterium]|nr:hypothetical protein [Candidatus Omnitrophota bacterium]MDZ4242152.1 hypothetical protein [Candidatus Omnitrophota bacterium]